MLMSPGHVLVDTVGADPHMQIFRTMIMEAAVTSPRGTGG